MLPQRYQIVLLSNKRCFHLKMSAPSKPFFCCFYCCAFVCLFFDWFFTIKVLCLCNATAKLSKIYIVWFRLQLSRKVYQIKWKFPYSLIIEKLGMKYIYNCSWFCQQYLLIVWEVWGKATDSSCQLLSKARFWRKLIFTETWIPVEPFRRVIMTVQQCN